MRDTWREYKIKFRKRFNASMLTKDLKKETIKAEMLK